MHRWPHFQYIVFNVSDIRLLIVLLLDSTKTVSIEQRCFLNKTFSVEYGKIHWHPTVWFSLADIRALFFENRLPGGYFRVNIPSVFCRLSQQFLLGKFETFIWKSIVDARVFINTFDSLQRVVHWVLRQGESSTVTDSETDNDFWTLAVRDPRTK